MKTNKQIIGYRREVTKKKKKNKEREERERANINS